MAALREDLVCRWSSVSTVESERGFPCATQLSSRIASAMLPSASDCLPFSGSSCREMMAWAVRLSAAYSHAPTP